MSTTPITQLPSPDTPEDALAAVVALRRLADRLEIAAVDHAVADGWTWAQIAQALGVTRQAAHKKHASAPREKDPPVKLPAPFKGMKALKTLVLDAEAEAKRLGDTSTGAEHLLIAALAEPGGSARRAFARAGLEPSAYAPAVEAAHDAALRGIGLEPVEPSLLGEGTRGPKKLNESAAHVLRAAASMSKSVRPELLGAQVVAAVAELEHGTAARALRVLDIDRGALAAAAHAEMHAIEAEAA